MKSENEVREADDRYWKTFCPPLRGLFYSFGALPSTEVLGCFQPSASRTSKIRPGSLLLVSQRFDRIEPGSFPGRPQSEDHADADAGDKTGQRRPQRHIGRHDKFHQQRSQPADCQSDETAKA